MSTPSHTVVEKDVHFTWFGLVLWDGALGSVASDGVSVRTWRLPLTAASTPVAATANRSGIFVAHGLPDDVVNSPDAGYLVEVRDTGDRFTSFVMHTVPPVEPETVRPRCDASLLSSQSPGVARVQVPLFNAPARTAPAGAAVVRATLVDATTGMAAEYAVLEVSAAGQLLARGISDARGQVAAMFAYPEPEPTPPWSPPAAPPRPRRLADQHWSLTVSVRYHPPVARYRPDPRLPALADLCDVLEQPYATVPPFPPGEPTLRYGEELRLGGRDGLFVTAS